MSEANRQTESKDPVPAGRTTGDARNFCTIIRFFDENEPNARQFPAAKRR